MTKIFLIIIFSILLLQIFGQNQPLLNATSRPGEVSPGNPITLNYQIENSNNGIMVEFAGETTDSGIVLLTYGNNILKQFNSANSLASISTDFSGVHSSGFLCPDIVSSGNSNITISTTSNFTSNYLVKVTEYNPSLNDRVIIKDEICCAGTESQVGKIYTYLISDSANQITIVADKFSERTSQGQNLTALVIRYDTCSSGSSPSQQVFDYKFFLPNNGNTSFVLNQTSIPPLQAGSMMFLTVTRNVIGQPVDGTDQISLGICEGMDCSVDFSNSNNEASILNGNWIMISVILYLFYFF